MSVRRVIQGVRRRSGRRRRITEGEPSLHNPSWIFRNNEWHLTFDDDEEASLLYAKHERVPLKDFGAEVRPAIDVNQFLEQSILVLDEDCPSAPFDLVVFLLNRMNLSTPVIEEAKLLLFTHDTVPTIARTIQATYSNQDETGCFEYDQSWVCALCDVPSLTKRRVAIARLKQPTNMGDTCHDVKLFALILCPSKEKTTKNALETGRTFATLLADLEWRRQLLEAPTAEEFKSILLKHTQELASAQRQSMASVTVVLGENGLQPSSSEETINSPGFFKQFRIGSGIRDDLLRRLPHYISDYKDGIIGPKTPQKVLSTTFFLYFACLLPAIAFGVLNDHNTHGKIGVKQVIMGQTIGGLAFSVFGGQPLVVLLTTAPLALYIKVISSVCDEFQLDFFAMYGCVGLFAAMFMMIFSVLNASYLMRWSTRSTEEIFGLFISVAFCVDAFRDTAKDFQKYYNSPDCFNQTHVTFNSISQNTTNYGDHPYLFDNASHIEEGSYLENECNQASSLLFLLLMFGTLWVGVTLYNFKATPYLSAAKREILADYALPIAVLVMSFVGSYLFRDVKANPFRYDDKQSVFTITPLERLPPLAVLGAFGLGFPLALLVFMDQNISSAMVNTPLNKLKKGSAYHWDLFVMSLLTAILSVIGLPWMHALVPHSPLHVRALADVEERVDQGHVYQIVVRVRETRLTSLFSHILIGLSLLLLPYPLAYIPPAVLNGLFLYVAVTGLYGSQFFERITLLFTEQGSYPPNHYIRRVPQRVIHQFTGCQVAQLLLMSLFGFVPWPYMKMIFPVILLGLLPIRHLLIPLVIERRYLNAIDSSDH